MDHDAAYDRLVDELVEAGLVERTADGVKLTPAGEQVARQLAMTDEGGQGTLMAGLLETEQAPQAAEAARWGYLSGSGCSAENRSTSESWSKTSFS
jgi:hypothetical protein